MKTLGCTKENAVLVRHKNYETEICYHIVCLYQTITKKGVGNLYIIHDWIAKDDKTEIFHSHIFKYNGKEVENALKHYELIGN